MNSSASSAPDQPPQEEWVRSQLRALPDPSMPPEVCDRLTAAVRAERANTAGLPALEADSTADASVTEIPPRSTRRRGILTGLAAAAAVVVGIAMVAGSTGGDQQDYENVVALSSVQPVSTNVRYTAENIEASIASHLRTLDVRSADVRPAADSLRRGSFAANDEVMASCLEGVGAAQANLRMVDLADYQGQPSGILVFNDSGGNLIVVVAPRCAAEDPRVRLRLNAPGQ